jgi:CRISPR-associated protein Cas1
MIKRTLYFGNPAYLSTRNQQMVVERKDQEQISIPIEDVGVVILDHPQITITQVCMARLLENNTALITCDDKHLPTGLLLNLNGHSLQSKKFQAQVEAGMPLKKQLWQQTIRAKIRNQAALLQKMGLVAEVLNHLAGQVKSGDTQNAEAVAAKYYWQKLMPEDLVRGRFEGRVNNFLNYGYAILRAVVARSLVGSGLLPALGIFHRNQYNAYCLADDIMEPYRPFVDELVLSHPYFSEREEVDVLAKKILLSIPTLDVVLDGKASPLMNAVQRTTASLARCYQSEEKIILYPSLQHDA